jgi:ADP-ribose pyrophosphatase
MQLKHNLLESTLESQIVFDGQLLKVYLDSARLPSGQVSGREWIKHPGACAIIPLFENGDVMLIKQFRYAAKQIFYEIPAGKIDPGEPEEITAQRELREEAGLHSVDLHYIGHQYPCIGYSDEIIHFYLAENMSQVSSQTDEDEFVELCRIPFTQALEWVQKGIICEAKTIIGLIKADFWIKNRSSTQF